MKIDDLRVYNQALETFTSVETIVNRLPTELLDIKRQVLRSSKAIAPLLSEGLGRSSSQKDFRHFVVEAMGTSDETVTHLETIKRSTFCRLSASEIDQVINSYKSISKQLNKLIQSINNNIQNPASEIRHLSSGVRHPK